MSDRLAAGVPHGAMAVLATPLLVSIFVVAVGIIWVAGVQLSEQTDVLATRLHLGSALGGLILLALATNLPEIAIVASASLSGEVGVAGRNILRGGAGPTGGPGGVEPLGGRPGPPPAHPAGSRSRRSSWWRWTPSASARAAR